jgi:hypothetical protein
MPILLAGRPVDWRVSKQAANNAQQLRDRAVLNELKPCSFPGCHHHRAGISRYCKNHRDLTSTRGDPIARKPLLNELIIIEHAISVYLSTNKVKAAQVALDLKALEHRASAIPPSFMLRPSDVHRGLPQRAKAEALKANWIHKHGRAYTSTVTRSLALIGWLAIYYDGLPENRLAFLQTEAGNTFGVFIKRFPNSRLVKYPSGATYRHLGREVLGHARAIYGGSSFWDRPVETADGQSMTILDYTRMALKAAGLLNNERNQSK